jgi:hypothetical protein
VISSVSLCYLLGATARGDRYYVGLPGAGTGNWNSDVNWSLAESSSGGAGVPGPTDTAFITNHDAFNRNINIDVSPVIAGLWVGNSGGGVTTLFQAAGINLTSPIENIGYAGSPRADYVQNGGVNTVSDLEIAGYSSIGEKTQATYTLNGGTLSGDITIGFDGHGTLQHNAGVVSGGSLHLGTFRSAGGVYNLVSGSLSMQFEELSHDGAATFTQTGGTHTIGTPQSPGELLLSYNFATPGPDDWHALYTLGGASASLIVYGNEVIGNRGVGTFEQSAGSHFMSGTMIIGSAGIGHGTYRMSGGSFTALGAIQVGASTGGSIYHTGGMISIGTTSAAANLVIAHGAYFLDSSTSAATLTVHGNEQIGVSTLFFGSLNQSGGNHNISGTLFVNRGGATVVGGAMSVPTIAISSDGNFTLGGSASLTVSTLSVAGNMTVSLNGVPALKVISLSIDNTTGKFNLTNNSMIVDYLGAPGTLIDDTRQDLQDGALFTSAGNSGNRLGYADNTVTGLTSFGGQVVDPTSLLIKFTYAGDANLDGKVDIDDLGSLATHWQSGGAWTDGDFDYNGVVDVNDLGLLATNWQAGVGNPLGASLADAWSSLGLPGMSVPEPTAMGFLAATMVLMQRGQSATRLSSSKSSGHRSRLRLGGASE